MKKAKEDEALAGFSHIQNKASKELISFNEISLFLSFMFVFTVSRASKLPLSIN